MQSTSTMIGSTCMRHVRADRASSLAKQVCRRRWQACAALHTTQRRQIVKQYPLADIGEGITECQIIQWRVQVGARVNEFDPLCEVASDKATTDIPSRYSGVIKKLYYEADENAIVGRPLVDIDVDEEVASEIEKMQEETTSDAEEVKIVEQPDLDSTPSPPEASEVKVSDEPSSVPRDDSGSIQKNKDGSQTLASPATRYLSKQHGVDISQVTGTGKHGRVMKDDIQRYVADREASSTSTTSKPTSAALTARPAEQDTQIRLGPIQMQMFKTMTKSLTIPHFLYTDAVDLTNLTSLRARLAARNSSGIKLSPLPFIVKAVSLALQDYPSLNAHLDTSTPNKPVLTHKASQNIGVAVDTPQGLVVPVVRDVQHLTITEIAAEIARLAAVARAGKLTTADLSGATFTVSNIGSIGGGAVAPVIVAPQVAILGVGRGKPVLAFADDVNGDGECGTGEKQQQQQQKVVNRLEAVFSWSADHRVCDGAMVARTGDLVRRYLEDVEGMVLRMR